MRNNNINKIYIKFTILSILLMSCGFLLWAAIAGLDNAREMAVVIATLSTFSMARHALYEVQALYEKP